MTLMPDAYREQWQAVAAVLRTHATEEGPRQGDLSLLIPQRRAILAILGQERTASEIAEHLGRGRCSTSQHLQVLLDAKLVSVRRDSQKRWYRADPAALRRLFQDAWAEVIDGGEACS